MLSAVLMASGGGGRPLSAEGPALLAQADALRAQSAGRAQVLARSARLEALARRRLFDVDGHPADTGNGAQPEPDVQRGAQDGARGTTITADQDRPWRRALIFRSGEPAFVYLRARELRPVILRVTDARGHVLCREHSVTGRALCGWRPPREDRVTVEVEVRTVAPATLDLFVN